MASLKARYSFLYFPFVINRRGKKTNIAWRLLPPAFTKDPISTKAWLNRLECLHKSILLLCCILACKLRWRLSKITCWPICLDQYQQSMEFIWCLEKEDTLFFTCKCYFSNKTSSVQSLIAFCLYQSWKDNQGNCRMIFFFFKVSTEVFKCLWSNSAVIARVINENIYKLWRRQTSGWEERLGNKSTTLWQGAILRKVTCSGNQQLTPEQDYY